MFFTSKNFQKVDMVVTFNSPSGFVFASCPVDAVIKIVREPRVDSGWSRFFLRFVHRHGKSYSRVFGHSGCFENPSKDKYVEHAPLNRPHVALNFEPSLLGKSNLLSVIASDLANLPGHRSRNNFVALLQEIHPELRPHIYGRGRNPIDRKEDALDGYMYSVAIENAKIDSYISEKFLDCIVRETVPIYYGAENIEDYFPSDCFIKLESLDMTSAKNILDSLSLEDYQRRLPAILEAKSRIINNMQLCCLIKREVEKTKVANASWIMLSPAFETVVTNVISSKMGRIVSRTITKLLMNFRKLRRG